MWVDLDRLYGPPDHTAAADDPAPGNLLKVTGRVPGRLRWWVRAVDGRWFGKVHFAVCDSYGAVVAEQRDALVPAAALAPISEEPYR